MEAMRIIGISDADQNTVLRCMSAILHLGNVSFTAGVAGPDGRESTLVSDEEPLLTAALLLELEPQSQLKQSFR